MDGSTYRYIRKDVKMSQKKDESIDDKCTASSAWHILQRSRMGADRSISAPKAPLQKISMIRCSEISSCGTSRSGHVGGISCASVARANPGSTKAMTPMALAQACGPFRGRGGGGCLATESSVTKEGIEDGEDRPDAEEDAECELQRRLRGLIDLIPSPAP